MGLAFSAAEELKKYEEAGWDHDNARLATLLYIMGNNDDTNIVWRSNIETLEKLKELSMCALMQYELNEDQDSRSNILQKMDDFMLENNLSPGGSADILCLSIFLWSVMR